MKRAKNEKVSVGRTLKALFSNQYWAICLGLWGVMVMMSTVTGTITKPITVNTYWATKPVHSPIYAAELIAQSIVVLIVPQFVPPLRKESDLCRYSAGNRSAVCMDNQPDERHRRHGQRRAARHRCSRQACVFPMIADCAELVSGRPTSGKTA